MFTEPSLQVFPLYNIILSSSEETLCEKHPHAKTLSGILRERASYAENRPDVQYVLRG